MATGGGSQKRKIRYNRNMNALPPPNIIYEQRGIIVFNKPPGLLTQAPPGIDSLELRARQFLMTRDEAPSKTKKIYLAKRVSAQFQNRTVEKKYLARVEGRIDSDTELLEDFMRKVPDEARSEIVAEDHPDAKNAALKFVVKERGDAMTLVEVELMTGRTHQIRLQLSNHGHTILGDSLYGSTIPFGEQTIDLRQRQIALHAWRIKFDHPIDDEKVELEVLPEWNS